jgi:hypothetical protein
MTNAQLIANLTPARGGGLRVVLNIGPNLGFSPRFQKDGVSLSNAKIQAALQGLMPAGATIKRLGGATNSLESLAIRAPSIDVITEAINALARAGLIA